MTAKELFENKYRERMATITEREWKRAKEDADLPMLYLQGKKPFQEWQ